MIEPQALLKCKWLNTFFNIAILQGEVKTWERG